MLRRLTSETDPSDWFAFAGERLRAADVLWAQEGLTSSGIEMLQEAVERFLKGYLIASGWRLQKTHDLKFLLRDARRYDPAFAAFEDLAEELTEDFFAQHYPGGDMTFVGENYEQLRHQTGELVSLIQQSLPQFFPPPSPPAPQTNS